MNGLENILSIEKLKDIVNLCCLFGGINKFLKRSNHYPGWFFNPQLDLSIFIKTPSWSFQTLP